ncbi:hypothetical protein FA95DRAFT_1481381 [Auriscalpium vulgare]|uniref:Uncharacterized protein n=1 Tax=Auriscalpium vulgare TaxID=40419 RepID=A0ACB8SD18_9AGAM|nr:hypothetical protein FA95DRAFT_1481381 [Auriscalpium vulgare]
MERTEELSLVELHRITSRTKGFFWRDYSLELGWNNMRYIIEAGLLQARLLNRTLVIPSFVYARSCEYNLTVCSEYAPMVMKGTAIGSDQWNDLPYEQQVAWRIPISTMFNLTHLQRTQSLILVSDYLRLHSMSPTLDEASNGRWSRKVYHTHPNIFEPDPSRLPSLHVVQGASGGPTGANRADFLTDSMKSFGGWQPHGGDEASGESKLGPWEPDTHTKVYAILKSALSESQEDFLDWSRARRLLEKNGIVAHNASDEELDQLLLENGWQVLYTFEGATKSIAYPLRHVVPRSSLRGWRDDFAHIDADVVVFEGDADVATQTDALRFSTPAARSNFATMVTEAVIPNDIVIILGRKLADRMHALVEGRLWTGAHMQRGDFIKLNLVAEKTPEDHIKRVKQRLDIGRYILESLHASGNVTTVRTLSVDPDTDLMRLAPPLPDDPFYVATDERDPDALSYFKSQGAILLRDLITIEDRHELGMNSMFVDVLGLVEQELLAHSAYFYGNAMSSYANVVINRRAARGLDPRTMLVD